MSELEIYPVKVCWSGSE